MNRTKIFSVVLSAALAGQQLALAAPAPLIVPIFDPAQAAVSIGNWKENWGEVPSGAKATAQNGKMVVTGNLTNQSYGCVYRSLEVDLDKTPFLEVDVESVSHHWYLILRGEALANGYVKIQADTDQTGVVQYDLRLATGLTGKQTFSELQFGVSTEESVSGNKGQTAVIKRIRLLSATAEGGSSAPQLFGPQNPRLSGWKNVNDDRSPAGVDIIQEKEQVTLRGNRANQSFGMMYKAVNLDLSRYSVLKFDVVSVTHHWYLIITHPELEKDFVRVQPDTNLSGVFYYDLADITGLKGVKDFRLQVGVSTNEQKPSVLGETMVFKEISFMTPAEVPSGAKVLKKKDLKFQQKIQAVAPRKMRRLAAPVPVDVSAAPQKGAEPVDLEAEWRPQMERPSLENVGDAFLERFAQKIKASEAIAAPEFRESAKELTVQNGLYKISFSPQNGAVLSITDLKNGGGAPLIVGTHDDSLWKIDTKDRQVLQAAQHAPKSARRFESKWDAEKRQLRFHYESAAAPAYAVDVDWTFDASDAIRVDASVENKSDKTFLSLIVPQGLLFNVKDLERVILPRQVGVAFKAGFFAAQKQWADAYPAAFAGFAWIGTKQGGLTVYQVQPENSFQPATMEIAGTDAGARGMYSHRFPILVAAKGKWQSPTLKASVGRHAYATVRDYARDNGIDKMPTLKEKLGGAFFEKLVQSPMVKVDFAANGDIATVNQFVDELPVPSIFHLANFWAGGFDRNYPDYLPPGPDYGSLDEFKQLVSRARQRGLLVMPYTNPTWWNDGPTVRRLKAENIGVRAIDGSLMVERYNGNPGTVVLPHHPQVIEQNDKVLKQFTQDVPMDILFHDQIGARRWLYQFNANAPLAYTQGLINQTARESKKIPLMTEGGFDRLMPYEAGFAGMTSMSYPGFKEYNDLWGAGNWEIDPISQALAHDKVIFYQHNLSDDVLADTPGKITWNMVHGFGLNVARTYIRQNVEKKWIALAGLLHRHVLSRMLGQKMEGYVALDNEARWSRFGDIDVYGNLSNDESLNVAGQTIAPEGFLVFSRAGDLMAGYLSRLNGMQLEDRHYLIIKTGESAIDVYQPDAKTTFLSVARPAGWKDGAAIRAYRSDKTGETAVPVAVEAHRLTFLFQADGGAEHYQLRYQPGPSGLEVRVAPVAAQTRDAGSLRMAVVVKNPGKKAAQDVKVSLAAWKLDSHSQTPALPAAETKGKGKKQPAAAPAAPLGETVDVGDIAPGQQKIVQYNIDVPATYFFDGKYVWFRVNAASGKGSQRQILTTDSKVSLYE